MQRRKLSRLCITLLGLSACTQAAPAALEPSNILLVGDSTVAPTTGWGDAFCELLVARGRKCMNLARAGRSSKSYRKEGSWKGVLQEIEAQKPSKVLVLIQFGHNDAGKDMKRKTDPYGEFTAIIGKYVDDLRNSQAEPVLVTPLARRIYVDGKIRDGLEPYADAMRQIAAAKRTRLIDLHARSVEALEKMTPVEARGLGPDGQAPDINHLGNRGAQYFARMIIGDLRL